MPDPGDGAAATATTAAGTGRRRMPGDSHAMAPGRLRPGTGRARNRRARGGRPKLKVFLKGTTTPPKGLIVGRALVLEAKVEPETEGRYLWTVLSGGDARVKLWTARSAASAATGDPTASRDLPPAADDPTTPKDLAPSEGDAALPPPPADLPPNEAWVGGRTPDGNARIYCLFTPDASAGSSQCEAEVELSLLPSDIKVKVRKKSAKDESAPIVFVATEGVTLEAVVTPPDVAKAITFEWTCESPLKPDKAKTTASSVFVKPELGADQPECRCKVTCQLLLNGQPLTDAKDQVEIRAVAAAMEFSLADGGPFDTAKDFHFLGAKEVFARIAKVPAGVTVKWTVKPKTPASGSKPRSLTGDKVRFDLPASPDWTQRLAYEVNATLKEEGEALCWLKETIEDQSGIELASKDTKDEWVPVKRFPPLVGMGARVRARMHPLPPEVDVRWELKSAESSSAVVEKRGAQEAVEFELPVADASAEKIVHTISAGLLWPGVSESAPVPTVAEEIAWLYEPPKELNQYVNLLIEEYQASDKKGKGYALNDVPRYGGTTEDLSYKGPSGPVTVSEASDVRPGASYCSGITFEVWLKACARATEKSLPELKIEGLTAEALKAGDFHNRWYILGSHDGPTSAFQPYPKLGKTVVVLRSGGTATGDPEEAQKGDFVQLWRRKPDGHTVIFREWVREGGEIVGVRYWSANTGTNGIGERQEKLKSKGGRVTEIHIARGFVPPIE